MNKKGSNKYQNIFCNLNSISNGDIIYVVSDILNLAINFRENGETFNIQEFMDAIFDKVGKDGTVLFPTFNWDFCRGEPFDYKRTASKTGALGNAALKRNDCKRSKHPIYSFAIWGKYKDYLTGLDYKSGFGAESIFAFLHNSGAKALVIGLETMEGLTFCHYVEEIVGVPFRYTKNFTAGYIDEMGNYSDKTYSMYVRDVEMDPHPIDLFKPLGLILEQLGVSKTEMICGIPFRIVDLHAMYEIVKIDIECNDARNMYNYNHIDSGSFS